MEKLEALYLDDSYLQEFEAQVVKSEGKYIILNQTAFYPSSGGQPNDTGTIICNNQEYKVVFVKKTPDGISHELDKEGLQENDKVKCKINWNRRYN
ncbi:MAG: alanyl-tRNA editing protein AlaX, partial [Nanoarchaeota archaeon]|nr:alanyl-tRNA editing protein AlaX [Nanoarchaeota archaeon]